MIRIRGDESGLYLWYRGEAQPDVMWVLRRLRDDPPVRIRKCFFFELADLKEPAIVFNQAEEADDNVLVDDESRRHYEGELVFKLGEVDGEYFVISKSVLRTENRFYIHRDTRLDANFFVAHRDISILRRLDKVLTQDLCIGGSQDGAMPEAAYRELLAKFPTSTELDRYTAARIDASIRDYADTKGDEIEKYQQYLNTRIRSNESDILLRFARSELEKYQFVSERLRAMLDSEDEYSEAQWQREIVEIVRIVFPKYIRAFEKVTIRDTVNNKRREIDIMLVDVSGHIDVIEIKKPFDQRAVISKGQYRDNFVPAKELSGSIMQLEKYILYLDKWGVQGEEKLTQRYAGKLPPGMSLRIVNPKGIVILGRSTALSAEQRLDFEVIKRKYRSIVDVITYDDLLDRKDTLVETFSALERPERAGAGSAEGENGVLETPGDTSPGSDGAEVAAQ